MSAYHCRPDEWCTGASELVQQGTFGPRGARFDRYKCPECGVSRPEPMLIERMERAS